MPVDLMQNFPYPEARDIQRRVLEELGKAWTDYDVFVVSAPTAFGKTAVSKTLMQAFTSVSTITPTNQLVEQYQAEFPDTNKLSRLDSYRCEDWARPCSVTRAKLGGFCKGCVCGKDMAIAKYRGGPGIYNYHIYLAHKLYRQVLIVDEAHNLVSTIKDRMSLMIWQHDYGYPSDMYTSEQMVAWIATLSPLKRKHKKIQLLLASLTYPAPEYQPQRATEKFNGKGTQRGRPEDRSCIKLTPVDISGAPPMFWPGLGKRGEGHVGKVVLLSATISHKDIEALGLDRVRVLYINAESPIPAAQRPIVLVPLVSVNRHNMEGATQKVAEYIRDVVVPHHPGQKGVVHASYQMARLLRTHLTGPQYLFHDRDNKAEVYRAFRAASPESGTVLVGSGLYEGIDLPEDLGRWQVIAKVPWQSLGSPAIRYLADKDPEWFAWETVRTLIQACGRISRTTKDYGVTLILDTTVDRLIDSYMHLFPAWYQDGLEEGKKLL